MTFVDISFERLVLKISVYM